MTSDIPSLPRIGAIDIAEEISTRIGSYVDMNFFQFLAVEEEKVRCWYMNSGGNGPSFEITLLRSKAGWRMQLVEYPPGTEQEIEVP